MPLRIKGECLKRKPRKKGKEYIEIYIDGFRAAMIQNEVITSHKKNVDIDWRWQDLEEKEDCEELAKVNNHSSKIIYSFITDTIVFIVIYF